MRSSAVRRFGFICERFGMRVEDEVENDCLRKNVGYEIIISKLTVCQNGSMRLCVSKLGREAVGTHHGASALVRMV
jgi:hypothetical protein